jgi:hypothetical protein
VASASGLAGTVAALSATADKFISANSVLNIVVSSTTTDGSLCLVFGLDANKEK